MNESANTPQDVNRREFLKGGSMATLMSLLGGVELFAQSTAAPTGEPAATGARVKVAVIGLGAWGREIVNTLGRLPQAEVAVICDTYEAFLKKGAKLAPAAAQTTDCQVILANKDISAVIVATPTHKHKDIVLAALKAGKHVYCEAPLAHTLEDAREVALAAKAAKQLNFQAGLQMRSDKQRRFLLPFLRAGTLGDLVMAKAHWHKKTSWRTTSPNPAREKELNWRLDKTVSLGLAGELGIHPIDQAGWYFNKRPVAITGFGSLVFWNKDNREAADDREVPDTIQAIIEYPRGVRMMYDATLANTFDSECEVLYGSDAAVMMRESRAWAFKEVDSRLWGWEVYARKETFFEDTGIALVADASKAPPVKTDKSVEAPPYSNTPLYFALSAFLRKAAAIDDFISTFGADDLSGLPDHLSRSHLDPAAGYLEGYRATVTAIKANEAIVTGKRIELKPEWYELG